MVGTQVEYAGTDLVLTTSHPPLVLSAFSDSAETLLDRACLLDLLEQIVVPLALDLHVCGRTLEDRIDQPLF